MFLNHINQLQGIFSKMAGFSPYYRGREAVAKHIDLRIQGSERGVSVIEVIVDRGNERGGMEFLTRVLPALESLAQLTRPPHGDGRGRTAA